MTHFTQGSGEGGWGAARADLHDAVPAGAVGEWTVERLAGSPQDLHHLGIPTPARRLLRWCHADRAALVLGSAEPEAHVDTAAAASAGLPVVRRRSGGASVVVGAGRVVWLDVVVPAGDALWDDDVGVAPLWLGAVWAAALSDLGVRAPSVHAGALHRTRWSPWVCFAGVGPGEVVTPLGKNVGISQRRTRAAALFQCGALLRWDPVEAVRALALDRDAAIREIVEVAVGLDALLDAPITRAGVESAFERALRERTAS